METRYAFAKRFCHDYLASGPPKLHLRVSEEALLQEQARRGYPPDYCECVCLCRALAQELVFWDAFLLHAAVVALDGEAYAFCAPSGVGKSTQAFLWERVFAPRATILNGDKPILRYHDGILYAYGTPWCGKEGRQRNMCAPLKAICFLERAAGRADALYPAPQEQLPAMLLRQVLRPEDSRHADRLFALMDRMLSDVPCFTLICSAGEAAVTTAYAGINDFYGRNEKSSGGPSS